MKAELDQSNAEVACLKADVARWMSEARSAQAKLVEKKALETEVLELRKGLMEAKEKELQLEGELVTSAQERKQVCDILKKGIDQFTSEVERLQADVARWVSEARSAIDKLGEKEALEAELLAFRKGFIEANEKESRLEGRLATSAQEHKLECDILKKEIDQFTSEVERLQADVSRWMSEARSAQEQLGEKKALETEVLELQKGLMGAKEKELQMEMEAVAIESVQAKLNESIAGVARLAGEVERLTSALKERDTELERNHREYQNDVLKQKEAERQMFDAERASLEKSLAEATTELAEFKRGHTWKVDCG